MSCEPIIVLWGNLSTSLIVGDCPLPCGMVCWIFFCSEVWFAIWNNWVSQLQHWAVILILLLYIKDAHVHHFGNLLNIFSVFSLFFRCRQNERDYFVYPNRRRRWLLCNGYIKKKHEKTPNPWLWIEHLTTMCFSGQLQHSVCYQTLTSCIFLNIVEACTIVDTRQPKKKRPLCKL